MRYRDLQFCECRKVIEYPLRTYAHTQTVYLCFYSSLYIKDFLWSVVASLPLSVISSASLPSIQDDESDAKSVFDSAGFNRSGCMAPPTDGLFK